MNGVHRTQTDHVRLQLRSLVINHACFAIYHMKLAQSTAFEQKRFGLRSLPPALRNLRFLLVFQESGVKGAGCLFVVGRGCLF